MVVNRALISTFYKDGIPELAQGLQELGIEIVSTGSTAGAIRDAGVPVTPVEEVTGFPEMMDGRVKTLHPKVHGGILAVRTEPTHEAAMEEHGIQPFDLVVVNLYPFAETVASGASFAECIEKIDIGGPTMIRAAAKNHAFVGVVVDPADYPAVLAELQHSNELSDETRLALAIKAFAHTAQYDLAVTEWLSQGDYKGMLGKKVQDCDYGENRWQSPAALYERVGNTDVLSVPKFQVVAGRSPSFINSTDVDRLLQTVTHTVANYAVNFDDTPYVAVAVKHGNPCGASAASTPTEAIELMLTGDTRAVFGAVIMTNFPITGELAQLLLHHATGVRRLLDGICAPAFDDEALGSLGRRDGKFFLAVNPALEDLDETSLDAAELWRPVRGGFLIQPNYTQVLDLDKLEMNGAGDFTEAAQHDVLLAQAVCATSNSNTVTAVLGGQLVANGVGQQDRVGCCELLVQKASQNEHSLAGAAVASDSFFPFPDGPAILIDAGVGTIYSTTGSNRDGETQELCASREVTLVQLPDAEARMFYRH